MAVLNPVSYVQGRTDHTAQTDRLSTSSLLTPNGAGNTWLGGVRGAGDMLVAAQSTPNLTVQVAAGQCYIPVLTALHGCYHMMNDASFNVTITTPHATLPRNDLIICRVQDSFFSGAINTGTIEVVTGVAASSPIDPSIAGLGSVYVLARVRVIASAASIDNAHIDDLRSRVVANGGILPVTSTTHPASPWAGQPIFETDTKTFKIWDGAAWAPYATAGSILAAKTYLPAANITTGGATFNTIDAVNLSLLNVVVPPSGNIDLTFAASISIGASSNVSFCWSTSAANNTNMVGQVIYNPASGSAQFLTAISRVTGLTPGTIVSFYLQVAIGGPNGTTINGGSIAGQPAGVYLKAEAA